MKGIKGFQRREMNPNWKGNNINAKTVINCPDCGIELTEEAISDGYCQECEVQITFLFDAVGLEIWGAMWG